MTPETDPLKLAQVTAWTFICGMFGSREANRAWVAQSSDFNGGFATGTVSNFLDTTTHYVALSTMKPGSTARSLKNFLGLHMIVLDDVGVISDTTVALLDRDIVEAFAPPPTASIETSRANHQVFFKLTDPETDPERATLFLEALKRTQFGPGVQPMSVVHYVRLPSGENTKPDRKGFKTKLKLWNPTVSYTLDELAAHFGLPSDWEAPAPRASVLGPRETLPNETVIGAMRVIPNTSKTFPDYEDWIRAGNIFKGSAESPDDPELMDAWVDWSNQMAQTKADPVVKWETFSPDLTHAGSLRHLVAIHAAHPKEGDPDFKERKRRALEADKLNLNPIPPPGTPGGFTVVDDGTLPGDTPEAKAKREIEDIFAEIAKSQVVPPQHAGNEDDNWLDKDEVQTLDGLTASGLSVAPPVMIDPHTRGIVTVVAGTPGKGKSLLVLQQALAISLNRPDLIRDGLPELNFPGDVVYLSNEDQIGVLSRRAMAWAQRHKVSLAAGPHQVIPLRSTLLGKRNETPVIECARILKALVRHGQKGRDIGMIIVDTLPASVSGFKENDTDDMSTVMRFLDRLAKAFWCSVIFIHHIRKSAAAEEDERTLNALRGSGVIGASIRGAIMVCSPSERERGDFGWPKDKRVIVEYTLKANDGSIGDTTFYELELEPVQVQHAVTLKPVMRPTPVLVPINATKLSQSTSGLQDALDKIKKYGQPIRIVDKLGPGDNSDTLQKILEVNNATAKEVAAALEGMGVVTITVTKSRQGYPRKVLEIVL